MDSVFHFLPKDKFDCSGIPQLKQLSDEEIRPALPVLLEWIQDMNWPVAAEVLPILALHQKSLVPLIQAHLQPEEEDEVWKYWIIRQLLPLFARENLLPVLPALRRIARQPTDGEKGEGTDEIAAAFLQEHL